MSGTEYFDRSGKFWKTFYDDIPETSKRELAFAVVCPICMGIGKSPSATQPGETIKCRYCFGRGYEDVKTVEVFTMKKLMELNQKRLEKWRKEAIWATNPRYAGNESYQKSAKKLDHYNQFMLLHGKLFDAMRQHLHDQVIRHQYCLVVTALRFEWKQDRLISKQLRLLNK